MADSEIAIHIVLIATLQSSLTPHFYGTYICTLTVKVNGICCIQNPLQALNTKRRGAKPQICWCEEMKFQSKIGNVKLFYIEGLPVF